MSKKILLIFSLTVVVISFLSFNIFAADQLKEIRFLCQASPAGEKYKEVFSGFEKYGFKVIVEQVPWVNYLEKAQLAVQSKVSPYDVINANVEWVLPSYVMSDAVMPLNEFIEKDPIDYNDFLSITLDNVFWPKDSKYKPTGTFRDWQNGLLYGIPSLSDTTPLSYRRDWFEEAGIEGTPKNWEEFLDVCQKMTKDIDGDGTPDRYGYAFASIPEGGQLTDYWMLFVYSWGADLLDENFQPAFNNQNGIEATQFMADLLHKHKVVPPGVLTYGIPQAFDAFKKGITAMTSQWGYALASVEDPNESAAAGNAAYGVPPSKDRLGARFAQWAYTIPTNARDPQASWEFIKIASSVESQIALLPEVAPSRQLAAEKAISEFPNLYLSAQMKTISYPEISIKPQIPNILELDAAVSYIVFEAIAGQKSVQDALKEAELNAIEVLKKSNLLK
jgi:multiple sugar transport system substrate-binding protein